MYKSLQGIMEHQMRASVHPSFSKEVFFIKDGGLRVLHLAAAEAGISYWCLNVVVDMLCRWPSVFKDIANYGMLESVSYAKRYSQGNSPESK